MRAEINFTKYINDTEFRTFRILYIKPEKWYPQQEPPDSEYTLYMVTDNGRVHHFIVEFSPFSEEIHEILEMADRYAEKYLKKKEIK